MQTLRDKGDQLRSTDQPRMERLTQLAEKESLSNAEMAEAEKLAGQLMGRYVTAACRASRPMGRCPCAEGVRLPEHEARTPKGPQGAARPSRA